VCSIAIDMKKIVLLASGAGSNVENIIKYFVSKPTVQIASVFCNNPTAKVIDRAIENHVPVVVFAKEELKSDVVLDKLTALEPDLIVLAGFLLQLPSVLIAAFPSKIINIHPALLPKYGGKGMYGQFVHQAVLDNNEKETGITVHFVNEHYDEGELIFQKSIAVDDCTTAEEIATKVHALEHEFFPKIIQQLLTR
jgi:phosphoribosylglycinamide formyltransferase 1